VLSHPDLNFDHLEGWLREQIATYKVPRKYRILDALPRNALGKVTKPAIKKIFLDENGD
jgi:malonyl-CoA/methylmalonyl-CoA synthetase